MRGDKSCHLGSVPRTVSSTVSTRLDEISALENAAFDIRMIGDSGIDNRDRHPLACAYSMGIGNVEKLKMPLLIADLGGSQDGGAEESCASPGQRSRPCCEKAYFHLE